ncbi:hypothetical protein [Sinomonas atrocyanea]|jgi:hypothetical protein|uniref:hypothetical protein n=1 Tax=Sinomonas atrocyanea TaxID=37927 RepID=UPI00285C424B|nr:hypothetical protein [Sinomonas atrocyanea]MDR6620860.1 hypothetical protein [Sinomonas atrocyanea]
MLPRSRQSRTTLHISNATAWPEHEHDLAEPPARFAPAPHDQRPRLLRELRQVGLGDAEAQAEADRLLAGDIWSG